MPNSNAFDIVSPEGFLTDLVVSYRKYKISKVKPTRDLLYIVMGLNHLREWIAPGFKGGRSTPNSAEEFFSEKVFQSREHQAIRAVCNASKHFTGKVGTSVDYGANIDDWPDFDSVQSVDDGPPTAHYIDNRPVEVLIEPLITLYESYLGEIPK